MKQVTIKIISDSEKTVPNPSASDNGASTKKKPKADSKEKKTPAETLAIYFARKAYYMAKAQATQFVNKYANASEMYKERADVQNVMSTIDFAVDSFATVGGMASMFSNLGFSGPVGAIIGIALTAINKGISTFNEMSNNAQRVIDSAYGNYFNATRAGFVAGGHDTEN